MGKNEFKTLKLSVEDNVASIVLNRPQVLNALSPELMQELGEAFDQVAENEAVRAVVITGAGRAFSSGGDVRLDIAQIFQMDSFEWREYMARLASVVKKITALEKPVIAAVNGLAVAGGLDIALACDIRVASDKARFSEAYVRMGLIPGLGGVYLLPHLVGLGRAKLLTFTGDMIDAFEAERIGLVDKIVPQDEFDQRVSELALKLAHGPSKAIAMAKVAINRSLGMNLDTSLDYVSFLQYLLIGTEDIKEGCNSFLEKREPVWKGK